jgi:hypothetical protein
VNLKLDQGNWRFTLQRLSGALRRAWLRPRGRGCRGSNDLAVLPASRQRSEEAARRVRRTAKCPRRELAIPDTARAILSRRAAALRRLADRMTVTARGFKAGDILIVQVVFSLQPRGKNEKSGPRISHATQIDLLYPAIGEQICANTQTRSTSSVSLPQVLSCGRISMR